MPLSHDWTELMVLTEALELVKAVFSLYPGRVFSSSENKLEASEKLSEKSSAKQSPLAGRGILVLEGATMVQAKSPSY